MTMVLDLFRLDGQVALVTGGDKGLGQGMAIALAEAGADVAVVSRSGHNDATLMAVEATGRRGRSLTADLGRADEAVVVVEQTARALGRLDILVNNAGIIRRADAVETGGVRVPAYTASKHAVAGLTKALANEWAGRNINVNAIAPGYMATDNTQALRDDPDRSRQLLERIPAGRWGTPDDLAGAVVFLASRASDYVNGHLLVVDGGWMAR